MENKDQVIPEDLAGYQHISFGLVKEGDIIVSGHSREKEWANASVGMSVAHAKLKYRSDVYRKMACPKAGDHDKGWRDVSKKAKTDDGGKPPLAMLPSAALRDIAMVQKFGAEKYGDFWNFKTGMEISRNLSCALRHIYEYMDGKDVDNESHVCHLSHAACRLMFVIQNLHDGTAIDDRYNRPYAGKEILKPDGK